MEAVCEGDVEAVNQLIAKGVDLDCFDDEQSRPLHVAAHLGHAAVASALIAAGADLESKGQLEGTPLHAAASGNESGLAALLLDAQACVDACDESGLTPLHRAAQRRRARGAPLAVPRPRLTALLRPAAPPQGLLCAARCAAPRARRGSRGAERGRVHAAARGHYVRPGRAPVRTTPPRHHACSSSRHLQLLPSRLPASPPSPQRRPPSRAQGRAARPRRVAGGAHAAGRRAARPAPAVRRPGRRRSSKPRSRRGDSAARGGGRAGRRRRVRFRVVKYVNKTEILLEMGKKEQIAAHAVFVQGEFFFASGGVDVWPRAVKR